MPMTERRSAAAHRVCELTTSLLVVLTGCADAPRSRREPDFVAAAAGTCKRPRGTVRRTCAGAPSRSLLADVNRRLFLEVAEVRPDTVAIDQHAAWLGHGNNADVRGCPHCGADNTSWMSPDRTHPNALGYAHMARVWNDVIDRMLDDTCR